MKKIKVNHGNVWGKGDWITHYCGKCGEQMLVEEKECKRCGAKEAEVERLKSTEEKYTELLMVVEKKYPDETRHDTALRYLKAHVNNLSKDNLSKKKKKQRDIERRESDG